MSFLYINIILETENRHHDPAVRQRILALADELFPEYGVKSVSMDEIARRLSMSKRTLYEYFSDKEELLLACIDRHGALMKAWADEIGEHSETVLHIILEIYRELAPRIRRISPKFHEDLRKYPKAMAKLVENRKEQTERTLEFFRTGVQQGIFLPGLNYDILSRTLIRMLDEPVPATLTGKYGMAEIYSTLTLTLVRGTCTDKGLRIFNDYLSEYKA